MKRAHCLLQYDLESSSGAIVSGAHQRIIHMRVYNSVLRD